ncbi:MAG: putative CRISPR-associated protein [Candidatus Brachytrichaceae bacterium NZ_4S206]|jgi:putative CRISPR-associated protein (TIGR02619 family)
MRANDKPRLFVSTVGTSLFTNAADNQMKRLLNDQANVEREDALSADLLQFIGDLEAQLSDRLRSCSLQEARRLSAELNGLLCGASASPADALRGSEHVLITTDTALGRRAGALLKSMLERVGALVYETYAPHRLRTDTTDNFQQGVRDLVNWCKKTLDGYRASHEVVFNLVGGFKTLQGYMTLMGMFYADRIVYIFERGDQCITIPRLPVQVDREPVKQHAVTLALLNAHDEPISRSKLPTQPPEVFVEPIDDEKVTISAWGQLLWQEVEKELFEKDLLSFPRLRYSKRFKQSFEKCHESGMKVDLQRALAKASFLLTEHDGDLGYLRRDGGLLYEDYASERSHDGQPIGHFRISGSRRVNCVYCDGELFLCDFGEHDVERNPGAGC